jgi:membrane associated rhomboid family serine protease
MIPLRDTIPSRRRPVVNYAIIATNVAVFVYEMRLGGDLDAFVVRYGLIPRVLSVPTIFTSMFLHGSLMHVLGNMLYLYIFGDNVEDRLGHVRYLLFYLACGVAAALSQVVASPFSGLPVVGASGAIAGVSGAYFLFYPRARVVTLVPVFFFLQIVEIPAFFFLLFWFLLQVFYGLATLQVGSVHVGGVAFWAHAGGFVAGMIIGPLCARPVWRR